MRLNALTGRCKFSSVIAVHKDRSLCVNSASLRIDMNKPVPHWHEQLRTWFDQQLADQEVAGQIWERACISDWRRFPDGQFGPDHPERGLILHWICGNRAVTRALQVETGRGYACAAMALGASQASGEAGQKPGWGPRRRA